MPHFSYLPNNYFDHMRNCKKISTQSLTIFNFIYFSEEEPWMHPHLRVRIIDKKFKKGKYFKEKVRTKVSTVKRLICQIEDFVHLTKNNPGNITLSINQKQKLHYLKYLKMRICRMNN